MSYNVAIVLPPVDSDDATAWKALDGLTELKGPRPAVFKQLHDRLTAEYPCMSKMSEDEVDDCVWSDGPLINNFLHRAAVLGMSSGAVDEVLPFLVNTANSLDLVVFDWATSQIYRPGSAASAALAAAPAPRSMKMPEVKALIVEALDPTLAQAGFKCRKSKNDWVRKIKGGNQSVFFAVWDYRPEFQFGVSATIRLDAAEEIDHKFSGILPEFRKASYTTHTNLSSLNGGQSDRYSVVTPADIATAGVACSKIIQERMIPFFDQCRDVQGLDQAVNRDGVPVDINDPHGAMKRAIIAHLAGNPDFERIVAELPSRWQYTTEIARPYVQLVEHLRMLRGSASQH